MNMWLARMAVKYPFLKKILLYFYPNLALQILLIQFLDEQQKLVIEKHLEHQERVGNSEQRRLKNDADRERIITERQGRCTHLKGGKYRSPGMKDYALADHMFPDASRRIWCLICAKPFTPDEAAEMLQQSTNTRSSSEIRLGPLRDQLLVQEAYTEEQKKEAMNPDRPEEYDEKFWKNVVNRYMVLDTKNYEDSPVVHPDRPLEKEPEIVVDKETEKS